MCQYCEELMKYIDHTRYSTAYLLSKNQHAIIDTARHNFLMLINNNNFSKYYVKIFSLEDNKWSYISHGYFSILSNKVIRIMFDLGKVFDFNKQQYLYKKKDSNSVIITIINERNVHYTYLLKCLNKIVLKNMMQKLQL